MTEVPVKIQEMILNERLQLWRNTQYQTFIDKRVADKLKDDILKQQAINEAARCEIAIAEIEKYIKALVDDIPMANEE